MNATKKRSIVICVLCGILLLMIVGYAAFNTMLNIEGTTSISSNWNILITNVEEKNKVGEASTADGYPTYENLTAEFQTNLVSPGDSIEYDITVENQGNLNAELARIKVSENDNEAIKFTTSGLEEGNILEASGSAVLTVKVEYSDEVTSQPDNLTANLTVTLDYVQEGHKSEWTPDDKTASEMLIKKVTTQGDGLYSDTYEPERYVYRGGNPNNYITFNKEEWRIISVENDGTIKIIKTSTLPNRPFDNQGSRTTGYCSYAGVSEGCNVWAATTNFKNYYGSTNGVQGNVASDSSLKTYLNGTYYNSITTNKSDIQLHKFYYGSVVYRNDNMSVQVNDEKKYSTESYVGLIQASDYIKANTNNSLCGNMKLIMANYSSCNSTSWMDNSSYFWTISPYYYSNNEYTEVGNAGSGATIDSSGKFYCRWSCANDIGVRPVVYLSAHVKLEGEGTSSKPYTIVS